MIEMETPCMGCKIRFLGCHSTCNAYLSYKMKLEDIKKAKERDREPDIYISPLV